MRNYIQTAVIYFKELIIVGTVFLSILVWLITHYVIKTYVITPITEISDMVTEKNQRAMTRQQACSFRILDMVTREQEQESKINEVNRLRMLFLHLHEHQLHEIQHR